MGFPMHNNIKELIATKTKEVEAEKNPPKDLVEEAKRVTGEDPDFSKMTEKQIQNWLDKGTEMLIEEVKRTKEPIKISAQDPKTGAAKEILIKADGKVKETSTGKEITKAELKTIIWSAAKGLYKGADVATRETAKAAQWAGRTAKSDINRITDVGSGSFGR